MLGLSSVPRSILNGVFLAVVDKAVNDLSILEVESLVVYKYGISIYLLPPISELPVFANVELRMAEVLGKILLSDELVLDMLLPLNIFLKSLF